jgi:hypothetical protein
MMFITPSQNFVGSSVEQQIVGWHMAHVYSQMPFTQLSYESVIVNPSSDHDPEIQQIMHEIIKSGHDVSDHVIPCIFTNYKELKRPVTSQIKPMFSFSEDMKKIMGAPYSGVVVISGKDALKIQQKMGTELELIMNDSLKQFKNFRILYNPTQESYGGVYLNIYLNNFFLFDHINNYEDDLILNATKNLVTDCDVLNSQLTRHLLARRLHQNNKVFQATQGKKFVRVDKNASLLSVVIKHDIISPELVSKFDKIEGLFNRDIDAFTDVCNYFGITKSVSINVEDLDHKDNRFTTRFTINAIEKMTIDLATFEEFLYVLKKSYEFQIYNYVTYADTELYKYSDYQPIDIKVTPEI